MSVFRIRGHVREVVRVIHTHLMIHMVRFASVIDRDNKDSVCSSPVVSMAIYTPRSIYYTTRPCISSGKVPFPEFQGAKDETIPYVSGLDD